MQTIQKYRVICHDHHRVVSARFLKISESGCELLVNTESGDPVFAIKGKIYMDILDEGNQQSASVHVRLAYAERDSQHWVYVIRWTECPAILRDGPKSNVTSLKAA